MQVTGQGFPKERRMRRREDFLLASRRGIRRHGRHFMVVLLAKEPSSPTRLGLTVSRKIGGAVERNRVKRLVREFFRRNRTILPGNTDISVVAKKGAADLDYRQVCTELRSILGLTMR